MSTARYLKSLVWVNGAVPAVLLTWDAARGRLGANSVNDAIRTTGLLALAFLTLSLVVTPLRQWTGWNQLLAVRRPLGLWGFYYACAHLTIYVVWDRALDVGSTLAELAARRYLQVGLAAIVLMSPLAITSTDRMVQRLGAKRWKRLHKLAYVAIPLGAFHYYLLVKSDVRQPIAFAGAIASLLLVRIARKDDRTRSGGRNQRTTNPSVARSELVAASRRSTSADPAGRRPASTKPQSA